jgi:hypothetical protein
MRYLKIALSVLALLVGAVATAMTAGLFNVPPAIISLVLAGAGFVSVLGIQPFPLSAAVSKVLSAASVLLGTVQVWHASQVTTGTNGHPWLWVAFGAVTVVLGVLGKSPISHTPPTAADGPLIPPAKPDVAPPKP